MTKMPKTKAKKKPGDMRGQHTKHLPRNSKGQFVKASTGTTKTVAWSDGSAGFWQWHKDTQPMIPSAKGGYELFKPTPEQRKAIEEALKLDAKGNFVYQTIAFSFPRRHSKTLIMALLVIWRFCTRETECIKVMANSERQTLSVGFKLLKQIILNTPALRTLIGPKNVKKYSIEYPKLDSTIEAVNCNTSGLYGEKVTVGWVSEIHAAASDEPMQVLASSLGDSRNSWLLVDSTCDSIGGILHRLEQLAESGEDETVYSNVIRYKDLQEALEKSPPWISKRWLESRAKQLLPAVFETQHLNQRTSSDRNLFAAKDIQACVKKRLKAPLTLELLAQITQGRKYLTGGGLDRAYFGSINGDATVWTSIAKVAGPDNGEPEYYVMAQKSVLGSLASGIKKAISKDMAHYRLTNMVVESYNSQDIYTWLLEQPGWNAEVIHPTASAQLEPFMQLYRLVKEGRLHIPGNLKKLQEEMETFLYELVQGKPKFGSSKFKDDYIYSLAWAIHSLREKELATYELPRIVCESKSKNSRHCFLRGGDLIIPSCSRACEAYMLTEKMFSQYRTSKVNSELTLPQFYREFVKCKGYRVYQAL